MVTLDNNINTELAFYVMVLRNENYLKIKTAKMIDSYLSSAIIK